MHRPGCTSTRPLTPRVRCAIRLRKSMIALYGERNPREGLALAEQTAETTSQVSDVLTGLAILHAAEAHAMVGELAPCEEALVNADIRFGRVGELDAAIEL